MSSNDEHAQSGDTIEITTHLRNDLGKRMQVSTSDTLSVIALDNRMRVTVAHGDYRVVKRCGRPATADAPKKRGRPSNAEIAARAAAERTPPENTGNPYIGSDFDKFLAEEAKAIVTDADVAGIEEAIAINSKEIQEGCNVPAELLTGDVVVHVTRKVAQSLADSRPNIPHETVMANARALLDANKQPNTSPRSPASAPAEHGNADKPAPGERETAAVGDLIEIVSGPHLKSGVNYHRGEQLRVTSVRTIPTPACAVGEIYAQRLDGSYTFIVQPGDYRAAKGQRATDDKTDALTQEQIDAATENLRPLYGVSQADFDAMTRQTEPRGFVQAERKHSHYFKTIPCNQIDVYRVLAAFGVADPCIQHALKKLLVAGGRGTKDQSRDVQEAIDSLYRWQEMRREEQENAA